MCKLNNEELVELYQNGDKKALDYLIQANTGIIRKIANKYNGINRELEFDDLFQNGVIGFIKSVEKYNPYHEKKAKFITYAVFHIDRYIYGCVNGWSSKDIGNIKLYNNCTSLEAPLTIGDDGSDTIKDFVPDIEDTYGFIEEELWLNKLKIDLNECMNKVNTLEEREILQFLFGFNSKPITLEEVGNIFNIKGERVRLKKNRAIRKLRQYPKVQELAEEYLDLDLSSIFNPEVYACRRDGFI